MATQRGGRLTAALRAGRAAKRLAPHVPDPPVQRSAVRETCAHKDLRRGLWREGGWCVGWVTDDLLVEEPVG